MTANSDDSSLHSLDLGRPVAGADLCAPDSSQRKSSGESRQHNPLCNSGSHPFRQNSSSGQKSEAGQKERSLGQCNGQTEGNDVLQRNLLAPYEEASLARGNGAHCMGQSLAALSEDASHAFQVDNLLLLLMMLYNVCSVWMQQAGRSHQVSVACFCSAVHVV